MKKLLLLFVVLFVSGQGLFGAHLKGGLIQYTYLGPGTAPNTSRYQLTVRQYVSCASIAGQRDPDVYVGIFNGSTNALIQTLTIPLPGTDNPNKVDFNPCITPRPAAGSVCY